MKATKYFLIGLGLSGLYVGKKTIKRIKLQKLYKTYKSQEIELCIKKTELLDALKDCNLTEEEKMTIIKGNMVLKELNKNKTNVIYDDINYVIIRIDYLTKFCDELRKIFVKYYHVE